MLLPFLLVACILTVQSYNFALEEGHKNDANTLDVIRSGILAEARRVEDLAASIATNASLLDILQARSKLTGDYYDKYLTASQFISDQGASFGPSYMLRINLFLGSEGIDIYEGFGRFYKLDRVTAQPWYKKFMQSGKLSMWFRLDKDDYYQRYSGSSGAGAHTFALVRRIFSYTGEQLGVLVIEAPDNLLITQYGIDEVFIQCSETSELLYSPQAELLELAGGQSGLAALKTGRTMEDGVECLIADFPEMCVRIGIIHQSRWVRQLLGENVALYIFLMAFMFILILAFAALLRYIIRSMSRCIRSIEIAIRGDEPSLLPANEHGDIGQLVLMFNMLSSRVRSMIAERVALETSAQNAQIHEMQARLSPHFFYNTLDVLSSTMLLAGQVEIAEAVADFGQMMRYSFRNERETTLGAELRCVHSYINLQKMRYKDKIELDVDVDAQLKRMVCMKFILQPIVENSIRHGMPTDDRTLHIQIRAMRREDDILDVVVRDDGVGIDAGRLRELRSRLSEIYDGKGGDMSFGVGLYNVNNQLVLRYGSRCRLRIYSSPGDGTTVILPISMKDEARNAEDTACGRRGADMPGDEGKAEHVAARRGV